MRPSRGPGAYAIGLVLDVGGQRAAVRRRSTRSGYRGTRVVELVHVWCQERAPGGTRREFLRTTGREDPRVATPCPSLVRMERPVIRKYSVRRQSRPRFSDFSG